MKKTTKAPSVLGKEGRELWAVIVTSGDYELSEPELVLVQEACECRDMIRTLRDAVARDGILIPSSQGERAHPGIEAARQYSVRMSQILRQLGVGDDEEVK
jgi:P27 family predicted phage terminase small subunit